MVHLNRIRSKFLISVKNQGAPGLFVQFWAFRSSQKVICAGRSYSWDKNEFLDSILAQIISRNSFLLWKLGLFECNMAKTPIFKEKWVKIPLEKEVFSNFLCIIGYTAPRSIFHSPSDILRIHIFDISLSLSWYSKKWMIY